MPKIALKAMLPALVHIISCMSKTPICPWICNLEYNPQTSANSNLQGLYNN